MSRRLPFFVRAIKGVPLELPPAVEKIARNGEVSRWLKTGSNWIPSLSIMRGTPPRQSSFSGMMHASGLSGARKTHDPPFSVQLESVDVRYEGATESEAARSEWVRHYLLSADYFERLRRKYDVAAKYPWLPIEPNGPEPSSAGLAPPTMERWEPGDPLPEEPFSLVRP